MKLPLRNALEYSAVALSTAGFVIYKLANLTFRYSDHNLYFFEASRLTAGILPHRDYFLTDPGLYVSFLALTKLLVGNHVLWLQAVPIFAYALSAVLLYILLRRWQNPLAFLAPALLLFSFSTLANSDYATGEEFAVLFIILGLLAWQKKRFALLGIALAVACVFKLYAGAIVLGILAVLLVQKKYGAAKKVTLSGSIAGSLLLLPFALANFQNFWSDVILFNLSRPRGLDKATVFAYFWHREWVLMIFALTGAIVSRARRWQIFVPVLFAAMFFLIFKDIYYLYFQITLPFLVVGVVTLLGWIWERYQGGPAYALALLAPYLFFLLISFNFYTVNWANYGTFADASEAAAKISALPKSYPLYGAYETAPLLSVLSGRPLFKNYYDTNPISFTAGRLNIDSLSQEAAGNGIYLAARITDLPEYNIKDFGYQAYFSESLFNRYCRRVLAFPGTKGSVLAIYECKK
jgi:hypothetical protein